MHMRWGMLLAGLAAGCGGGGRATVEAAFAPGASGGVDAVSVAESGRSEGADSAGFRLTGLTPGPARLRLLRGGDTVGILQVAALPAGARLRLHGLRVDPPSGLAFPASVELDGARTVTVNGVRMGSAARIPRRVDLRGAVLGWSAEAGALLLRPDDPGIPDLRVLVTTATEVVGTDGGGADPAGIAVGDTVRVEGRREDPYVSASRLVLPTRIATVEQERDAEEAGEVEPAPSASRASSPPAAVAAPAAAAPRPAPPAAAVEERGPGQGRGRGKGKAKGREPRG